MKIPWFKVDDKFHSHPKVMELSTGAVGLWTLAGAWCADYLTDGEIRRGQIKRLGGSDSEAAELVAAGLWIESEAGYSFRDWHDYQPTRESVEADKEVARRRWAMNNNPELRKAVRGRDGNNCRYCAKKVNWSDRRGEGGGTYDHVIPMSAGGDESAENIVVACRECNYSKGARTPDQAGMTLLPPRSDLDKTQNGPRKSSSTSKPPVPVPVPDPVPKDSSEPNGSGQQAAATDSAQSLIGEWIDACQDRPPGRVIGQLSKEIKGLLDEGHDYQQVRSAVQEWNRKGMHPSTLPSVLHETRNKQPPQQFKSAADQRLQKGLDMIARRMPPDQQGQISA